ncbi:MAG: hypothetical protein ACI8P3_004363 [Saprospiraceae bacterium]|jgi:hypothetical protein
MKNFLSISLLFLFAFQIPVTWEWFTSETGLFSVLTPGEMIEKVEKSETAVGELSYHTFYYQPEDDKDADNFLYMVSYCDYPEGSIHSDSLELLKDFYDATIETSVHSVKGELFYQSDIKSGGYPGKIWRVNYGDNAAAIKTKAFLVKNRYYAVQTITLRDKSLNPSVDKFLDSFKIITGDE